VLKPGAVATVSTSDKRFHQMENIGFFLAALSTYGVRDNDSFQTVDLFEQLNVPQVVNSIHHLARIAVKVCVIALCRAVNATSTRCCFGQTLFTFMRRVLPLRVTCGLLMAHQRCL